MEGFPKTDTPRYVTEVLFRKATEVRVEEGSSAHVFRVVELGVACQHSGCQKASSHEKLSRLAHWRGKMELRENNAPGGGKPFFPAVTAKVGRQKKLTTRPEQCLPFK
eukprot:477982-Pelagomonas_calceolata.AAC.1